MFSIEEHAHEAATAAHDAGHDVIDVCPHCDDTGLVTYSGDGAACGVCFDPKAFDQAITA